MLIHAALLGGLGLFVGSFLGLVSWRLPRGEGVVFGRSRCGGCGKTLSPLRLLPLLSWALSRGRCADCDAVIPRRYPLMEAGAGLIGLWAGLGQPAILPAVLTAVLGWQLLLLAVVDAENFWLPDQLTLPLFLTGTAAAFCLRPGEPLAALAHAGLGAVIGFGGLWLIGRLYQMVRKREGLGGGDPFMLGAGGAWVGALGLPSTLLWAALAGLSLVLARLLLRRSVKGDDRLPFGVFLAVGLWMTWLYGPLGR
ncbi:prepilin peptidase [Brevundimonas faecalis]|uniref:prepilin peptidase n=1 Tax=Brevundimonas faecalis TaxID=947378 RepID=UPI0036230975